MARHPNFTAERVAAFSCPAGKQQKIYWDGKTPGLGLRVTAAGAKSYVFEASIDGRTLRTTIGDVRTWSIRGAQDEATALKALTDKGIDPRNERAKAAADAERLRNESKRLRVSVADAWAEYVKDRRPTWGERHLADHAALASAGGATTKKGSRETEPGALASLMPLNLAELDAGRVRAWLKTETARRPTQAALAYRLLRAFLNWCQDNPDYCGVAAKDACNPRIAKDSLPRKSSKSDCLQREQLEGWFTAVRGIQNPVIAAYLQALLLTGARREELAGITWSDVDFRWRALTIRDKVDGERTIPMTPYVASLLSALPRRNEWVFSSPAAKSGRLQEPRIQHSKVASAAGLRGLTLHGLRRSFGTLSEWVECPAGVAAQIMGHKPSATAEKHYRVRPLDLLRMWHSKIEAWILGEARITFVPEQTGLRSVDAA